MAERPRVQSEPILRVSEVSHVFGTRGEPFVAVDDVSFDVGAGEFVGLVGPSGCGKSTLLKIIGGLMPSTSGSVSFDGARVTGSRRDIGLMFQTSTLFPWRSVLKNVRLPLEIRRDRSPESAQRIAEVIELVGLTGFEGHYPRELSGGMQQRVALSRLLVSNPGLMLLDEPFASLDEFTREHLNLELARISEHENKTTVFVTHNIPEAVFLSDRVVVMSSRPGRLVDLVEVGLPRPRTRELLSSPTYLSCINQVRQVLGLA